MKRLVVTIALVLAVQFSFSQELFLIFEFMKVEDKDLIGYMENEDFWEKVHQEGVKEGAYTGWDLWSLKPGGLEQGYQFLVVTVYANKSSMLKGSTVDQITARAQKAYPDMAPEKLTQKLFGGAATRSRAKIAYLEQISSTEGEFDMPLGTFMTMGLMKATADGYEKAEMEIFKPLHQKMVNDGAQANWGFVRYILPSGTDTYASHMTVRMYKDVDQFVNSDNYDMGQHVTDWDPLNKGLETRDLKWIYHGTLMKKVR